MRPDSYLENTISMKVLWKKLPNTLNKTKLKLKLTIHTKLLMEFVNFSLLDLLIFHKTVLYFKFHLMMKNQFKSEESSFINKIRNFRNSERK
jgi:hypothetical protein